MLYFDSKLILLASVCAVSPAHAQCESDDLFQDTIEYDVGQTPRGAAIGDLDGDGDADLVIANRVSDDVSVLLNRGDGTFASQVRYDAGDGPWVVELEDFDSDGDLDVVVVNQIGDDISIMLGHGDGTFSQSQHYGVGENPRSVSPGDFDGDGVLDLLVANFISGDLSLLPGHGDGTFQGEQRREAVETLAGAVAGDLNGDGLLDVAAVSLRDDELIVMLGLGEGAFSSPERYAAGDQPQALALGDLDQDGDLDVAVVNKDSRDFYVFLNQGDGQLGEHGVYDCRVSPRDIRMADLDGDSHLDVVVAAYSQGELDIRYGLGDGTFGMRVLTTTGAGAEQVEIGDLDQDGDQDLVGVSSSRNTVSVMKYAGDRMFHPMTTVDLDRVGQALLEDVNGDGVADLVMNIARGSYWTLSVFTNSGLGSFTPSGEYSYGAGTERLSSGDFDNDGDTDFAVLISSASSENGTIVFLNEGDGSLSQSVLYGTVQNPHYIISSDLDGDGVLDLIVYSRSYPELSVLLGVGDGTFHPEIRRSYPFLGSASRAIAAGDFGGDGYPDLAFGRYNRLYIFKGNGDGTFDSDTPSSIELPEFDDTPHQVVVGDVNGDGDLDLVTHAYRQFRSGSLYVLLGQGDGSVVLHSTIRPSTTRTAVALEDLNQDGMLDVALVVNNESYQVWNGHGDGTFSLASSIHFDRYDFVLGDVDADGDVDAVVFEGGSFGVSIVYNACEASCRADINGDGVLSFFDVSAYLVAYLSADLLADFDQDGMLSAFDVMVFVSEYSTGCP